MASRAALHITRVTPILQELNSLQKLVLSSPTLKGWKDKSSMRVPVQECVELSCN